MTAEELRRHPERATTRVVERVLTEAATFAGAVDIGSAVPLTRDIALSVAALVAMTLTSSWRCRSATASAVRDGLAQRPAAATRPDIAEMRSSRPSLRQPICERRNGPSTNPDRFGSDCRQPAELSVSGAAARRIRFGEKSLATSAADGRRPRRDDAHRKRLPGDRQPVRRSSRRRLIAVAVTPDRAPSILIEAPGKDLLVPDSRPTIPDHDVGK